MRRWCNLHTNALYMALKISFKSPHAAIQSLAKLSLRNTPANDTDRFSALEQNVVFRLVLSLFGTVSQLLKLCGMYGFWGAKLPDGLSFGSIEGLGVILLLSSEEAIHHGYNTCCSQVEERWEMYVWDSILTLTLWFSNDRLLLLSRPRSWRVSNDHGRTRRAQSFQDSLLS